MIWPQKGTKSTKNIVNIVHRELLSKATVSSPHERPFQTIFPAGIYRQLIHQIQAKIGE
jgi:hypothetical protein